MKAPARILVALVLFVTVGGVTVARNAIATPPRSNLTVLSAQGNPNPDISDGDGEVPDQQEEQQEDQQLQSLARITAAQAQQFAETAQPGTVDRMTLDNEDGNLVYKVVINQTEIIVDAGNGRILQMVQVGNRSEQNDSSFHSSIQVPEGQDGDREVNDAGDPH